MALYIFSFICGSISAYASAFGFLLSSFAPLSSIWDPPLGFRFRLLFRSSRSVLFRSRVIPLSRETSKLRNFRTLGGGAAPDLPPFQKVVAVYIFCRCRTARI